MPRVISRKSIKKIKGNTKKYLINSKEGRKEEQRNKK